MFRFRNSGKSSLLADRFTRGALAGFIAAIPVTILNHLSKVLFATVSWSDFAGTMIFGHKPQDLLEFSFASGGELFFTSLVGGIFALLIPSLTSRNLLFKGWTYSCLVWFGSYAVTLLFKVPGLAGTNFKSAFSNFVGASLWGILLGYFLIKLTKKLPR